MLAALLGNIPQPLSSGPLRGYVSAGTAWNKDWSKKYGPDARKPKKKIKRAEIEAAVDVLTNVITLPAEFNEAADILDAYSVSELLREQAEAHYLLVIYQEYMLWREEEDIATLLLLM